MPARRPARFRAQRRPGHENLMRRRPWCRGLRGPSLTGPGAARMLDGAPRHAPPHPSPSDRRDRSVVAGRGVGGNEQQPAALPHDRDAVAGGRLPDGRRGRRRARARSRGRRRLLRSGRDHRRPDAFRDLGAGDPLAAHDRRRDRRPGGHRDSGAPRARRARTTARRPTDRTRAAAFQTDVPHLIRLRERGARLHACRSFVVEP